MSRIASILAVQAESATIGWQVYTLARETRTVEQSAFLVGMVGLVQFVPLFLLTLIAGAAADRCDRRAIMLICTAVEIVCVLALAASRCIRAQAWFHLCRPVRGLVDNIVIDDLFSLLEAGSAARAWSIDDPRFTAVFLFSGFRMVSSTMPTPRRNGSTATGWREGWNSSAFAPSGCPPDLKRGDE